MKRVVFLLLILCVPVVSARCNLRLDYFVGSSMEPAIYAGDKVFYRHFFGDKSDIDLGDIVLVRYRDHKDVEFVFYNSTDEPDFVVHRVYAFGKGGVVTKGDNNPDYDHTVFKYSEIAGVVCRVRRSSLSTS